MAPHSWRMQAQFDLADRDVAEIRDHTRSLIAGFASGAEPMTSDTAAAGYTKVMRPENFRQANIFCQVCGGEWVPGEALADGPDAGDECPGPPTT